jgi:hypothetical protein
MGWECVTYRRKLKCIQGFGGKLERKWPIGKPRLK